MASSFLPIARPRLYEASQRPLHKLITNWMGLIRWIAGCGFWFFKSIPSGPIASSLEAEVLFSGVRLTLSQAQKTKSGQSFHAANPA